jgi:heptosyltransferase-1
LKFNRKNPKYKQKNLLLINSGQIGDLIISSIILENPEFLIGYAKVIFLIKNEYLELFKDYNGSIEVRGYDYFKYKYNLIYKIRLLHSLTDIGFNKSINLSAARGILNDEITLLVNAEEYYCLNSNLKYLGDFWGGKLNGYYTKILTRDIINEYNKHLELLKFLNQGMRKTPNVFNLYLFNTKEKIEFDISFVKQKLIFIAPVSSSGDRDWGQNNFEQLVQRLKDHYHIVLVGSEFQKEKLLRIKSNSTNVSIMPGKLRLNELPTLLMKCDLFIGLDSGLSHLALKLNKPMVAIIGGGQYDRFFPWGSSHHNIYLYHKLECFGCDWQCIQDKPYCYANVTVDQVYQSAIKLLKEK